MSQVNSSFWVYLDGMPEYDSDYDFYDENPQEDGVLRKKFESRIRMPLRMFRNMVQEMESRPFMQEVKSLGDPLKDETSGVSILPRSRLPMGGA